MYKIYIDDRQITICSSDEIAKTDDNIVKLTGSESVKELGGILLSFEENPLAGAVVITSDHLSKTWKTISEIYTLMEAAGGIVLNKEGKLLMIFRNDHWDLPKGKLESGEKKRDAALREVTEETGVSMLTIERECTTTYHIYKLKKNRMLKITYWFRMHSSDNDLPVPQQEEGIELAQWMSPAEVKNAAYRFYSSINNLLRDEALIL